LNMNKKSMKIKKTKISGKVLHQFAENRRIFNKAVEKAIEENKKAGIPEKGLYAQ
jgi:hypothetical protein